MELSKTVRIVLIITAGIVLLGYGVLSFLSGAPVSVSDLLPLIGGILGGVGIAGGSAKK